MTTENTIFKYKGRFVPLKELEALYQSNKEQMREEEVEISETTNGPFIRYKISFLIKLYGDEKPFRRIPKQRREYDPLAASSSSSSDFDDDDDDEWDRQQRIEVPSTLNLSTRPAIDSSNCNTPTIESTSCTKPVNDSSNCTKPTIDSTDSNSDDTISDDSSDDADFWENQNGTSEKTVVNGPKRDISPTVRLPNGTVLRCKDFPLFNINYERMNDLITGNEVLMEMDKLRDIFPLDDWGQYEDKKFRHIKREENITPICRVCKYTPSTPFLFFQHLLNVEHAKKLAECQVSRSSFKYWTKRLTAHMEKKNKKQINQKEKETVKEEPHGFIALFAPKAVENGHFLTESEVTVLCGLFKQTDRKWFEEKGAFFYELFEKIHLPKFCKKCKEPIQKSGYHVIEHITTGKHLGMLKNMRIDPKEFHFWKNSLMAHKSVEYHPQVVRVMLNHNKTPIPLVDFKMDRIFVDVYLRARCFENLAKIWKEVPREAFEKVTKNNEFRKNPEIRCFYCGVPKFSSRVELFDHIFQGNHKNYLITFGFPETALKTVEAKFRQVLEPDEGGPLTAARESKGPPPGSPSEPSTEQPGRKSSESLQRTSSGHSSTQSYAPGQSSRPSSGQSVRTSNEPSPEPSLNGIVEPKSEVPFHPKSLANKRLAKSLISTSRVPLLDPAPPNSTFLTKEELVVEIGKLRNYELNGGTSFMRLINNDRVGWTCTFCSSRKKQLDLQSKFVALQHIVSKKHVNNVSEVTTREDVDWWMHMMEKVKERVKMDEVKKNEELRKGPSNEPRVPLLDVPERNSEPLSRTKYRAEYYPLQIDSKMVVKSEEWMKEVNCKCLHCPGAPSLSTLWDVMHHIFDAEHSKNMMFTGTENDFKFWIELINKSLGKNAVFKSFTKNEPRVPLLDLPESTAILLDKKSFESHHQSIRHGENFTKLVKTKEWEKEMNCKCFHCPRTPFLATLWDVKEHVFMGGHRRHIDRSGTIKDLKFWSELIQNSIEKQMVITEDVTKNTKLADKQSTPPPQPPQQPQQQPPPPQPSPPSQPPQQQAKPSQQPPSRVVPFCDLQLYQEVSYGSKKGPSVLQAHIVNSYLQNLSNCKRFPMMKVPMKCRYCQVELTSGIALLKHAFSVQHNSKTRDAGVMFTESDYNYWINLIYPPMASPVPEYMQEYKEYEVGSYTQLMEISMGTRPCISVDEILNVDTSTIAVHTKEHILSTMAGCRTCDEWFFEPKSIFYHYNTSRHFEKLHTIQQLTPPLQPEVRQFNFKICEPYVKNHQMPPKPTVVQRPRINEDTNVSIDSHESKSSESCSIM